VDSGRCSIRLKRHYAASPKEVWEALTDPESIRRWLDPSCELSLHAGGTLELAGGRISGSVRAVEPERLLELDWDTDGDRSVVRFELTTDGSGTVLVLDHERIDERIGMAYMQRWKDAINRFDRQVEP
jgi:uncharacterized protein YndB with AHSA1/START domain